VSDIKIITEFAEVSAFLARVRKQLETEPLTKGTETRCIVNPLVTLHNTLHTALVRLLKECGLTPTRRESAPFGKSKWDDLIPADGKWEGLI